MQTYLSRGKAMPDSAVYCRGAYITLSEQLYATWVKGQAGPVCVSGQEDQIDKLYENCLVVTSGRPASEAGYQLLGACILKPKHRHSLHRLNKVERWIWKWLKEAGLHLTAAELISLREQVIYPIPDLLGIENRQALTEAIYTPDTILFNRLEQQMERAKARDEIVSGVYGLLAKEYMELR